MKSNPRKSQRIEIALTVNRSVRSCGFERGRSTLPIWFYILASVIKSAVVLGVLLTAVAYTVWLERKVVGHMQNRWGPTRVGPFGLLQPAADGLKFLFREDLTPPHVYKPLFLAAPLIAVIFALP